MKNIPVYLYVIYHKRKFHGVLDIYVSLDKLIEILVKHLWAKITRQPLLFVFEPDKVGGGWKKKDIGKAFLVEVKMVFLRKPGHIPPFIGKKT